MRKRIRLDEIWKRSPIHGERYEVSSLGRVRNADTGKILKGILVGAGYLTVNLFHDGISQRVYVHILVCEAFNGPKPSPDHEVNHKNLHKDDNYFDNLEWFTRSENVSHALSKEFSALSPIGEKCVVINMQEFCRTHRLDQGSLSKVLNGLRKSHKGWRAA